MNKILKDQLLKVKAVDIDFNDDTTTLIIPKSNNLNKAVLKRGDCYLIKISDVVINNKTLLTNWNNGVSPKYSQYTAEIVDILANMVKIDGVAKDDSGNDLYSERFFGWLPTTGFKVIKKL